VDAALNGRSYLDLALRRTSHTKRAATIFAETSAVPGAPAFPSPAAQSGNTFIVDGLTANDDAADCGACFTAGSDSRVQVVTSGGGASSAASAGINILTQSGCVGFFRRRQIRCASTGDRQDPLTQNQYGFTLGGPIAGNNDSGSGTSTHEYGSRIVTIAPAMAAINRAFDAFGYRGLCASPRQFPTGYDTTNLFGRAITRPRAARASKALRLLTWEARTRGVGGLSASAAGRVSTTGIRAAAASVQRPDRQLHQQARAQYAEPARRADERLVGPRSRSTARRTRASTSSPTGRDIDVFRARLR
jgi:hypothetical protein